MKEEKENERRKRLTLVREMARTRIAPLNPEGAVTMHGHCASYFKTPSVC